MLLEVIAKSIEDVHDINNSNAHRIELCKDLNVGGLTPDYNLIKHATDISTLPINVIVRPSFKSFVYSEAEKIQILKDIEFIKTTKANGIVFGGLIDKNIDVEFLKLVIKTKEDLEITFHKAFDEVNDFIESYKILNELNINNVLTSGGTNINKGFKELIKLRNLQLDTKILVGGGVNLNNIKLLSNEFKNIHIGRLARFNNSWDSKIDILTINNLLINNL
ncbi:copper homeostasis protein CutC [Spiroplasma turonicum]|uniref:Copper homeostasis protein cutC homolog n=1 Tax=Spiroplasma turonicum TaxID=216946 RepID=A0A0K1P588_9MOLU|nr:copper homeostasis protein CutC [Spiroplasma turonicum]AKU79450.1 copper homeostasis protein [Spiroplasma turonicum]ALX70472.1 copper homeostasis protein [Spiroplasma turonicum]